MHCEFIAAALGVKDIPLNGQMISSAAFNTKLDQIEFELLVAFSKGGEEAFRAWSRVRELHRLRQLLLGGTMPGMLEWENAGVVLVNVISESPSRFSRDELPAVFQRLLPGTVHDPAAPAQIRTDHLVTYLYLREGDQAVNYANALECMNRRQTVSRQEADEMGAICVNKAEELNRLGNTLAPRGQYLRFMLTPNSWLHQADKFWQHPDFDSYYRASVERSFDMNGEERASTPDNGRVITAYRQAVIEIAGA